MRTLIADHLKVNGFLVQLLNLHKYVMRCAGLLYMSWWEVLLQWGRLANTILVRVN